jgi:hypothetical protein
MFGLAEECIAKKKKKNVESPVSHIGNRKNTGNSSVQVLVESIIAKFGYD